MSIRKPLVLALSVLWSVILVSSASSTTTVFDNFGAGWDYNTGLGWTVAGPDSDNPFGVEQAMGFVPGVDGILADVWVAMAYVPSDPGPDVVALRLANDDGGRPGLVLEEWIFSEIEDWYQWYPPLHGEGGGSSHLEAGVLYWLWATPTDSETWAMWNVNNIDDVGDHTLRREGEDWLPVGQETRSVFRIDVEEPTGVPDRGGPASATHLEVWPNPAREEVCIRYGAGGTGEIELAVFDVLGCKVRTLFNRISTNAAHKLIWDGRSDSGHRLPPGTYFYQLRIDDRLVESERTVLLR